MTLKALFVTSSAQMSGVGGGVTHTKSMLALFRAAQGLEIDCLELALPWAGMPRSLRQLRALIRSRFSEIPAKSEYAAGREVGSLLSNRLRKGDVDCVVFNGADLLPLRRAVPSGIKTVLVSHNVESEIIREQVAKLRLPWLLTMPLLADSRRTRLMEIAGAGSADLIVAISTDDADWYRNNTDQNNVIVVAAAFAQPAYSGARPKISMPLNVAYLAKMSWWPNREGAHWLIQEILPQLPAGRLAVHFYGPGSLDFDGAPGVTAKGYVDNLDNIWSSAHFTLCPILGGSGVNIKLLESLYNGVPVLTTPHGFRGLPPIDDPAIAVVEPERWAAFLTGDGAVALANAKVRDETRAMFSLQSNVGNLEAALRSL